MATEPIHDGDTVAASGAVRIFVDDTAELCPEDGLGGASTLCAGGVPITGVDVAQLAYQEQTGGYTIGQAYIEGTWHDGAITVADQAPPRDKAGLPNEAPPCPAPPGGWDKGGGVIPRALSSYIKDHPNDFSAAWLGYPLHKPGTAFTHTTLSTAVITVGVVGDLDGAEPKLRERYSGNLCLTKAPHSAAELHHAFDVLLQHSDEMDLNAVAIGFNSHVPNLYTVMIEVDRIDDPLWQLIQQVGPDLVDVRPWLHKVAGP